MALFASKRKRKSRTSALRPTSAIAGWLQRFADRRALVPLLFAAATIAGLAVAVEAWRAPFRYRQGDVFPHGLTAKGPFSRLNRFETEKARQDAADAVPPIFVNESKPLENLHAKLRSMLATVAQAEKLADLSDPIKNAFGFTPAPAPAKPAEEAERIKKAYATLKVAVSKEEGTAGNRIDDLVGEFKRFTRPMLNVGRIQQSELAEREIAAGDTLVVVTTIDGNPQRRNVLPQDVVLADALKDTGLLGKEWTKFSELHLIRPTLERWLLSETPVTLRFDGEATQEARRKATTEVIGIFDKYNAEQLLVKPGHAVDLEHLATLHAEYTELERLVPFTSRILRTITVVALLLVLAGILGYYLVVYQPKLVWSPARLAGFLGIFVFTVMLSRALSFDPWRAEAAPLVIAVMVLAIAYDQQLAVLTTLMLSLVVTLSTRVDIGQFVTLAAAASVSILPLTHIPSRSRLVKVGFMTAAAGLIVAYGAGVLQGISASGGWADWPLLKQSLRTAGWCLVAGYLVAGSLPFIEQAFGVVTDISLLEMSDVSHPLLQELVRRAPGTYNHSMAVATIGETAADAIAANGLLVRVGAYFHDIGKMLKPEYFVENMTDRDSSRHNKLAPAMSTLIIIGHVKDGADLARQHNLPDRLIDFVEQHHGTTLVEYFYHEATKQAEGKPDKTEVEESSYRYPGPKPQSKEAGVMMLADAVESASRALSEPTPRRIETLVQQIVMKRLLDDQLDESSLTLTEIRRIEQSLIKSLIGVYHGRIKYPEQRSA